MALLLGQIGVPVYAQSQPHAAVAEKNVLVLYSEDKAHPAHELTDRGIRSAFRSNKLFEVRLYGYTMSTWMGLASRTQPSPRHLPITCAASTPALRSIPSLRSTGKPWIFFCRKPSTFSPNAHCRNSVDQSSRRESGTLPTPPLDYRHRLWRQHHGLPGCCL